MPCVNARSVSRAARLATDQSAYEATPCRCDDMTKLSGNADCATRSEITEIAPGPKLVGEGSSTSSYTKRPRVR